MRIAHGGTHGCDSLGRKDQQAKTWRESESGWDDKGILCHSYDQSKVAVGTTTKVGIYRSGIGLYLVAERLESGFATNSIEVGSLEVGLTLVNIWRMPLLM